MQSNAEKCTLSFYNHVAKEYDQLYSSYISNISREYARVLDVLADSYPNGEVLEIGCGTGALTRFLTEYNDKVVAIDICDDILHIMNERMSNFTARDRVQVLRADIVNLPEELRKERFPLVVFWGNGITHIPCNDYTALAKSISDALQPGGYFALNYRDGNEWSKNIGKIEKIGEDDNGAYYFFIYAPESGKVCDKFEAALFYIPREDDGIGARVLDERAQAYFCDFCTLSEALKKYNVILKVQYQAKGLYALRTAIFTKLSESQP